jgi:hypothetical protein
MYKCENCGMSLAGMETCDCPVGVAAHRNFPTLAMEGKVTRKMNLSEWDMIKFSVRCLSDAVLAYDQENDKLRQDLREAQAFRSHAKEILDNLDLQAIGEELGLQWAEKISPNVLPAIKKLKARKIESAHVRAALQAAVGAGFKFPGVALEGYVADYLNRVKA